MKNKPEIIRLDNGSICYEVLFDKFYAKVYVPHSDLPVDDVNFGFMAPYLLVFEEKYVPIEDSIKFADDTGLAKIASNYGSSVVFIYPTNDGGWKMAPEDLFKCIIDETKIGEFYEDGTVRTWDRFSKSFGDYYIRGALHRSYLYGYGESADFIARSCMKTIIGNGLYGEGDITPVVCILQNLNEIPDPDRRDIQVVSVCNREEVDLALSASVDNVLVKKEIDYVEDFNSFIKKYRRMVGKINIEEDFDELGMVVEPGVFEVNTSKDNSGQYKDTAKHNIGYVAYYNRGIMDESAVPLVLCFHGGGDSAMCMVALTDWHLVVHENDFLLVSVENHTSSTATEAIELLEHLKEKYNIDNERIYATGFSMGGVKSWDMFQEYPEIFAGVAPMDATFDLGYNVFGDKVEKPINDNVLLPVFYVGGENSPLPELPFHEEKCLNRMADVMKVNKTKTKCNISYDNKMAWPHHIMGINGDEIRFEKDENTGSIITMHYFYSEDGNCYTVFASASKQSHEMRHLNCENAWKFLKKFKRNSSGNIEII